MNDDTPDQPTEPRPCLICGHPVEPSRVAAGWATCTTCARGGEHQ